MTVTFLDTQTGEKRESCRYPNQVIDGNWSCDCNRGTLFGVWAETHGVCSGRRRFIAVGVSDHEYSLKELNASYPADLLKAHGIV